MNAPLTRRFNWHPASFVAASLVWMLGSGLNPVSLAAVDAPTVGWRSDSLKLSDNWNTLSLDMTVMRKRVTSTGTTIGTPAPGVTYHVERSSRTGTWKTVVTIQAIDRASLVSMNGLVGSPTPFPVARLEDDEDGTPIRAYDSLGRSLSVPPLSSPIVSDMPLFPTRTTGKAWINTLVSTNANKSARQLTLERKYGKAVKVNSLMRYRKSDATTTEEVLVNGRVDPVVNNLTRNTKLVSHREFTYGAAYPDAVVRVKVKSETEIAPTTTDKAVVETYFHDIKLERR